MKKLISISVALFRQSSHSWFFSSEQKKIAIYFQLRRNSKLFRLPCPPLLRRIESSIRKITRRKALSGELRKANNKLSPSNVFTKATPPVHIWKEFFFFAFKEKARKLNGRRKREETWSVFFTTSWRKFFELSSSTDFEFNARLCDVSSAKNIMPMTPSKLLSSVTFNLN